jgi:hypothetical protein
LAILDFPAFWATRRDLMKAMLTRLLASGESGIPVSG